LAPKLHSIVPEKLKNSSKIDPAVERAQKFRERAYNERNKNTIPVSISEKQRPHYSKAFKILEDKIELSLFIQEQELFDDKLTITEQYDTFRNPSPSSYDIETPRIGIDSKTFF